MTIAVFTRTIDAPSAPERLRGRTIAVSVNEQANKLEFATEVPDDVTPNEMGYLRWFVGEFVDQLKEKVRPGLIGDATCELKEAGK